MTTAAAAEGSGRMAVYRIDQASPEVLLSRLEGIQKAGRGHRARCPACGGTSRKLSITYAEGKVLIHCFGGCETSDVLQAVGLNWSDIQPPRHWPESPEERRQLRRAAREAALITALPELAYATAVVRLAAQQLHRQHALDEADYQTLLKAEEIIGNAREFFCESKRLGVTHG